MRNDVPASAAAVQAEFKRISQVTTTQAKAIDATNARLAQFVTHLQRAENRELIRENVKESLSYTNVVMGIGYAGAFALWQLIKTDMPPKAHIFTGLALAFSLAVYVGWEVYRMIVAAWARTKEFKRLSDETINWHETQPRPLQPLHAVDDKMIFVLPVVLALTIVPAVLAGATILGCLVIKLVQSA